jgi:hypothetical protein
MFLNNQRALWHFSLSASHGTRLKSQFSKLYNYPRADGAKRRARVLIPPPRLFTPGETKALAKCKVHQWPRAWVTVSVSVGGHLTDLKNMAVCQEWRGNKYKNACRKASVENRFAYKLENTCMQKPSPCWQNHCIFRTWSIQSCCHGNTIIF